MEIFLTVIIWVPAVPDSWGKLPDGILYGNFQPWGMMEECIGVIVNEDIPQTIVTPGVHANFKGKYCLITYR